MDIDLSTFTYTEFLGYFFDRPVLDAQAAYAMFHANVDSFDFAHPGMVVAHLKAMCVHFAEVARAYSPEQLEQGFWALFGGTIGCMDCLFDATVDLKARVACIESMYIPFSDVFSCKADAPKENLVCWMWWDMILVANALIWKQPKEYRFGYVKLTADEERIIDAIYRTCWRILDIDHRGCQWSAIHGMGISIIRKCKCGSSAT